MDFDKLDKKLSNSNYYKFTQKHKKFILIIQGMIIIGLLVGIDIYVVQDHFIKKQIAENCGYVTNKYKCICEAHYAENWEELQHGNFEINLSNAENVFGWFN